MSIIDKEFLWKKLSKHFNDGDFHQVISLIKANSNVLNSINKLRVVNLGAEASLRVNDLTQAKDFLEQSIEIKKDQFEVYYNFGVIYELEENYDKAEILYRKSIEYNPNSSDARFNLTNILEKTKKYSAALYEIESLIQIEKSYEVYMLYGSILTELKKYSEAMNALNKALILRKTPDVLNNIARIYRKIDDHQKFFTTLSEAYDLDPNNPLTNNNLGVYFEITGNYEKAISHYMKSLSKEESPQTKLNIGVIQLKQQNFEEGWINFENRWKDTSRLLKVINSSKPLWNGCHCESILVWGEQGIGDEILYASMLNELLNYAKKIYYACSSRKITSIMKRNFNNINILHMDDIKNDSFFDFHIPIGSLGRYLRKSINSFHKVKYKLKSDPTIRNLIKSKFNYPLIGISWKSNDESKNLNLEIFKNLSKGKYKLINLQYNPNPEEKKLFDELGIIDSGYDLFNDIEALLALIDCCDFVITTSNINAHLSGAANKKTFLLNKLGLKNFHYWCSPNNKSLWYPSVEIVKLECNLNLPDKLGFIQDL